MIVEFHGDLRPHQQASLDFLVDHPNALLADDVGLGKTPTALAYAASLESQGLLGRRGRSIARVLWVTDPSLLAQTKGEVERFLPGCSVVTSECPEYVRISGRTASMRARAAWDEKFGVGPDMLILSYQQLLARRHWLERTAPRLLVLDEVSHVNSGKRIYDVVRDASSRADRAVGMTATVVENDALELHRVLAAIRVPDLIPLGIWERDYVAWRKRWITPEWYERVPAGWADEATEAKVRAFLRTCMVRHTEAEVGLDLPTRVGETEMFVPLSAAQMAAYEAASTGHDLGAVRRMETASVLVGYESALVDAFEARLAEHQDQAIVYCETLAVLDVVEDRLRGQGISVARVDGNIKDQARAAAVAAHRAGEARVLVGSRVLERGLNLQHCRRLYSLDPSWNYAREQQRQGRMRRLNSPHSTFEHLTILPDTKLARAKWRRLDVKRQTASAVLDVEH